MKKMDLCLSVPVIVWMVTTVCSGAYANPASEIQPHIPRDGDRLHPCISFDPRAISTVDPANHTVRISTDMFSPADDADVSVYVDGDTLSYVQFATKHLLRVSSDTLSYIGYDNRHSEFRVDRASTPVAFVSGGGTPINTAWTGRMTLHGKDLLKRANGISHSYSEDGWILVSDTDTLTDVTCTTWEMNMAYFDVDSIERIIPDSIASESISDYSLPVRRLSAERMLTRREMWFVREARYPVFLRGRSLLLRENGNGTCDTIPLSSLAIYYPPSFQYSDTGEEPERKSPEQEMPGFRGDGYSGDEGVENGTLQVSGATLAGNSVCVTLSATDGHEDVTLTLYTDSGIRLTDPARVRAGAIPKVCAIPLPENVSGVLVVLAEYGSGNVSRKIIP